MMLMQQYVKFFFEQDTSGKLTKIIITDNGDGMTLSVIQKNWFVI